MLNKLLKEYHDFCLILLGVMIGLMFSSLFFWSFKSLKKRGEGF